MRSKPTRTACATVLTAITAVRPCGVNDVARAPAVSRYNFWHRPSRSRRVHGIRREGQVRRRDGSRRPHHRRREAKELTVTRDTPASVAISSCLNPFRPTTRSGPPAFSNRSRPAPHCGIGKRITTALICKGYLRDTPLADKHRLSGHRKNVKSGRNQANGTRQFVATYQPAWTKLSNTILRPALSKSTVSLLPSTVATVPVPNFG
jgi:hypothetical protein